MPEHLRALVVILVLAGAVFVLAKAPLVAACITTEADYTRRRNLWFAITLAAFLPQNFWLYALATGGMLLAMRRREGNPLALFFVLLLAVPPMGLDIPGFGLVRYLFTLTHPRLLVLCVLLPAAVALLRSAGKPQWMLADKLLGAYLVFVLLLQASESSVTQTLRTAFLVLIDIVLPYFVASRGIRKIGELHDALAALLLLALVSAAIGIFEAQRSWLLYGGLNQALDLPQTLSAFLLRGNTLRASAATGQPIVLGFVVAVGLGALLALWPRLPRRPLIAGLGLLVIGLLVPISRGPWVGAAVIALVFVATGPSAAVRIAGAAALVGVSAPLLVGTALGDTLIGYLPYIGDRDAGTVDYRERLFTVSIEVVRQNFWFGSTDFLSAPELQEMRQGQGIIDVVNSYLGVALQSGVVGLALFSGTFAAVASGIVAAIRRHAPADGEHVAGRALLATLIGALVTIATVSSISVIATLCWTLAGLGVAYARLPARSDAPS